VKIRGFRIEPGEIRAVLCEHPDVRDAAVVAREDAETGKRLIGYLVSESGSSVDVAGVREFAAGRLPGYMVPAVLMVIAEVPLTANGKLDSRALPEPSSTVESGVEYVPPRTEIEIALAEIWQQVLGIDRVGLSDNFFELGGDSILSLQIVSRARAAGLTVEIADIFAQQTVGALAAVAGTGSPALVAEQGTITGPVPLTPIQHWFLDQDIADRDHWNWSGMFGLVPDVDVATLARAADMLLAHHDALRMRLAFDPEEQAWTQANAADDVREIVARIDAAGLDDQRLRQLVTEQMTAAQASLNLADGPLMRMVLFDRGQEPAWLGITVHHLVMDGISWDALLDDLNNAYEFLRTRPQPPGEPAAELARRLLGAKTTSFKTWAERLQDLAAAPETLAELPFWLGQLEARPGTPLALPTDLDGPNTEDSTRMVAVRLEAEAATALQDQAHEAYHTQTGDLVLAALLQALGRWAGTNTVGLELEGDGRGTAGPIGEDIDLARTVGWFSSIFPVILESPDLTGPGALLTSVKERLRNVPRDGIGYGMLRHLTPATPATPEDEQLRRLRSLPTPQILFVQDAAAGDAPEALAPDLAPAPAPADTTPTTTGLTVAELPDDLAGPRTSSGEAGRERPHLLRVETFQADDGDLVFEWYYSANVHHAETVQRIADEHVRALRELIEHCLTPGAGGFTPSDFPLAGLDQSTLDALIRGGGQIHDD
jgi:hypothetical protein